jgi:hypothetical protein
MEGAGLFCTNQKPLVALIRDTSIPRHIHECGIVARFSNFLWAGASCHFLLVGGRRETGIFRQDPPLPSHQLRIYKFSSHRYFYYGIESIL